MAYVVGLALCAAALCAAAAPVVDVDYDALIIAQTHAAAANNRAQLLRRIRWSTTSTRWSTTST